MAPLVPKRLEEVCAIAFVNKMLPKFANGTGLPFTSKSSTIHSAFWPPRLVEEDGDGADMVVETDCPLLRFLTVAAPRVEEIAITDTLMLSPAEIEMPEKSLA